MPDVVVHHLERSRSHRVLWLLEELGVEYRMKVYQRDPKTMRAPPELARIHPLGKAPVVTVDGDVLAESGAIVDELVDRFGNGRLRPEPGTDAFRRYRFWLHYAEGSFSPPLLVKLLCSKVRTAPVPFFVKPIAKEIAGKVDDNFTNPELVKHFAFIEAELAKSKWFAGDELSAADVQMSFPMEASMMRATGERPRMQAWLDAVRARPAYQRAIEKGGPVAGLD
jgi:glutathione S-transferase